MKRGYIGGSAGLRLWQLLLAGVISIQLLNAEPKIATIELKESEFIFTNAPFKECHASTIAQTGNGLVAAWFGGSKEGHDDVTIWLSRNPGAGWTAPVQVAVGLRDDGARFPCWNPVLFQPRKGPLLLFYKVGPSPRRWWGMMKSSRDNGQTWSEPRRLPAGILGPIKNKPVELTDGTLLCGSSTEDKGWRVHFERTPDLGNTWEATKPVNDGKEFGAIQPSILFHGGHKLEAVGRTRQEHVFQIWSDDEGRSWGPMSALALPNPNAGTDAVTLTNGIQVLVYNHSPKNRTPLNVAVSRDGVEWEPLLVLEDVRGEFSYPAVIQASNGLVHVTYTWRRERIKHAVLEIKPAAPVER